MGIVNTAVGADRSSAGGLVRPVIPFVIIEGCRASGQIGSGAKGAARTGDDHRADCIIGI